MWLWLILACNSGDPCRSYVKEYTSCVEESGTEPANVDPALICQNYDDKDPGLVTFYECMTNAYARDCTTAEGYTDANAAASTCSVPAS